MFRNRLKMLIISPLFIISIIILCVLMLTSEAGNIYNAGQPVSIISILWDAIRGRLPEGYMCTALYQLGNLFSGNRFMTVLLPSVVGFSSMSVMINERETGEKRFEIERSGIKRFCLGDIFAGVVCALLISFLAYVFSSIVLFLFLHGISPSHPEFVLVTWKLSGKIPGDNAHLLNIAIYGVLIKFLDFLLLSVKSVLISYLTCLFVMDIYLSFGISFLLLYIFREFTQDIPAYVSFINRPGVSAMTDIAVSFLLFLLICLYYQKMFDKGE